MKPIKRDIIAAMRLIACLAGGFVSLCAARDASAQIQLDRFFPAAVHVGESGTVTAEGKLPNWPPRIHCDREDVHVAAGPSSGELVVRVDATANPGVAWIRLSDASSASRLVPLMIESMPVSVEHEPNEKLADATPLVSPAVVCGRLQKSGDLDGYKLSVQSGQTLVVSLTAHRILNSPMDAVLQLADSQGNVLEQADDSLGLDPQIVHTVADDGDLYVRVFAFPETPNSTIGYAGGESFVYVLRATTGPFLDHVLPLVTGVDPRDGRKHLIEGWNLDSNADLRHASPTEVSPATAWIPGAMGWQWIPQVNDNVALIFDSDQADQPVMAPQIPFVFSGHLRQPGETDRVRFSMVANGDYRMVVESKRFGFQVDSVMRLINISDGQELARNDDRQGDDFDAAIDYQAKSDGEVELQITDLVDGYGPRHAYSVAVQKRVPGFQPSVSEDHVQLQSGSTVEIPISIARDRQFEQRLEFTATGLPDGVTVESVISEPKGESAKAVKLKLTAAGDVDYQGTFQLIARAVDADGKPTGQSFKVPFLLRPSVNLTNLWLSVARESK